MKYFNSITGQWEDDNKPEFQESFLSIPAGRAVDPTGRQDVQIPMSGYAEREMQNFLNYKNADMSNVPDLTGTKDLFSQGTEVSPAQAEMEEPSQSSAISNPVVKKYLQEKFFGNKAPASTDLPVPVQMNAQANPVDQDDEYLAAQRATNKNIFHSNLAEAGQKLGAAIAGVNTDTSFYDKLRTQAKKSETDVADYRKQSDEKLKSDITRKKLDPNSEESKRFRDLVQSTMPNIAKAYGENFSLLTAADKESVLDFGKMREQIDARREQARILSASREDLKTERQYEKQQALATPYGMANTVDDAKKLKEGYESKKNFDSKLQELIKLRKSKGGELYDREAVARGKQLSKDLLLEYKNMAGLGVLSKADEDILNAIIPDDPLAFSMMPGQDPIMTKLESFQKDSDKDFQTRVATRTRSGTKDLQTNMGNQYPKQIKKGNQTATVSSEAELREARAEGWE